MFAEQPPRTVKPDLAENRFRQNINDKPSEVQLDYQECPNCNHTFSTYRSLNLNKRTSILKQQEQLKRLLKIVQYLETSIRELDHYPSIRELQKIKEFFTKQQIPFQSLHLQVQQPTKRKPRSPLEKLVNKVIQDSVYGITQFYSLRSQLIMDFRNLEEGIVKFIKQWHRNPNFGQLFPQQNEVVLDLTHEPEKACDNTLSSTFDNSKTKTDNRESKGFKAENYHEQQHGFQRINEEDEEGSEVSFENSEIDLLERLYDQDL